MLSTLQRPHIVATTLVIALSLLATSTLAGCGKHSSRPHRATGSTSPTPLTSATGSPSPLDPASQAAVTAYRGMWDAFVEAGKTSDPDLPALRTYATDNALKLIVNSLYSNRQQGKVTLGELRIDPTVTPATSASRPGEATITDCVNDERWLVYWTSGGLVNSIPGGRHRTTATVRQADTSWKVTDFVLKGAGTC